LSYTIVNETAPAKNNLKYTKEDSFISFNSGSKVFSNYETHNMKQNVEDLSGFLDLRSNKTKILFSGGYGIYNFFQLSVPVIFRLADEFPDAVFVFDYSMIYREGTFKTFVPFTKRVLDLLGIENYFVNNDKISGVIVNNFIQINTGEANFLHKNLKDAVTLYRQAANLDSSVKPFRKVYLSRSKITPRKYSNLKPGLSTNQDNRLYDEKILEEYMISLGLEVVSPENFKSMEEQVKFFNEVETLVSLTSSGLANALFMQEKTRIVELLTTIPFVFDHAKEDGSDGNEQVHHLYHNLSYLTNKEYISIPNYTRQPADLIGIIEESNLLQKVLRG